MLALDNERAGIGTFSGSHRCLGRASKNPRPLEISAGRATVEDSQIFHNLPADNSFALEGHFQCKLQNPGIASAVDLTVSGTP